MSNEHDAPRNDDPPRTDDGRPVHDAPRIDDGSGYGDQRTDTTGEPPRYGERITPTTDSSAGAPTQAWGADGDRDGARRADDRADDTPTQAWGADRADDRRTDDRAADATPTQAYAARDDRAHDGDARGQWSDDRPAQQDGQQYGSYGQQHDAGQQYGTYGQQHDQRHDAQQDTRHDGHDRQHGAAAAVYGQPNDTAWQSYDEPKPVKKKKTVGVVAFVVALLALVAAIVGGYLLGHAITDSSAIRDYVRDNPNGTMTGAEQERLGREIMSDPAVAGQFAGGSILFVIGTVLGIWAIVQGIIAAVVKRGRAFGVLAIVIAVVALVVFGIAFGSTVASGAGSMV